MKKIFFILAVLFSGCATQTLPGKVVFVDRVVDGRRANSGETGIDAGIAAAQGAISGGATTSSAGSAGLGVGGAVAVIDAILNRDKTVTVYGRLLDGTRISFNQKPTPEIFQFRTPGERGVYTLDKDGDLVLIPY